MLTDEEVYIHELLFLQEQCDRLQLKQAGSYLKTELGMQNPELVEKLKTTTNVYSFNLKRALTTGEVGHLINRTQLDNTLDLKSFPSFIRQEEGIEEVDPFQKAVKFFAKAEEEPSLALDIENDPEEEVEIVSLEEQLRRDLQEEAERPKNFLPLAIEPPPWTYAKDPIWSESLFNNLDKET